MAEGTRREPGSENGTRTGTDHTGRPGAAQGTVGFADLVEQTRVLLALLRRYVMASARPGGPLTYREAVDFLAENRPAHVPDARGVIQRKRRTGAWFFRVFYIDESEQPITDRRTGKLIGFTKLAPDCDGELKELFGENDFIFMR